MNERLKKLLDAYGYQAERMEVRSYKVHRGVFTEDKPEDTEIIYLGLTLTMPRATYETIKQQAEMELNDLREPNVHALLTGKDLDRRLDDDDPWTEVLDGLEPVPGGVIERYEIVDSEAGGLIIVWRAPYRKKSTIPVQEIAGVN